LQATLQKTLFERPEKVALHILQILGEEGELGLFVVFFDDMSDIVRGVN